MSTYFLLHFVFLPLSVIPYSRSAACIVMIVNELVGACFFGCFVVHFFVRHCLIIVNVSRCGSVVYMCIRCCYCSWCISSLRIATAGKIILRWPYDGNCFYHFVFSWIRRKVLFFFEKGKMHLGVHCTLLMNNSISIYHIYVVYIHMQLNWKFYSMST